MTQYITVEVNSRSSVNKSAETDAVKLHGVDEVLLSNGNKSAEDVD